MTEDVRHVFEAYLAGFFETDRVKRDAIMRANIHPEVEFSNPGVAGRGIERLLEHVDAFQEKFPGGRFEINWLRQQHRQVLSEWTQFHRDGSEFISAHSYALINDAGLIVRFAGFWDPSAMKS
jgi:hypothetical protein